MSIIHPQVRGSHRAEWKGGDMAIPYRDNPTAPQLRAMNMLYEAMKERGSMVVVASSVVETMGLGGHLALAGLGGARPGKPEATAPREGVPGLVPN